MANDLSTPSVGLQVQEQRAQTQQAPMVDVSGVARGQPDWKALGEAGRKFSNTVNDLYQETAAKYELLKYQQELGDIERRYITSPGNGSPEEMRKLQAETDKAWNRFKTATGRLNSDKAMSVIGEANEYGRRYRDSILNQQAKFVETHYQKNQSAKIVASTEDYVYSISDYGSEAYYEAKARAEKDIVDLLKHNGFSENDPEFKRAIADAHSKAGLNNIKFHVANKDFSKGWDIYNKLVKDGILKGQDRTDALNMLLILKDEQSAKVAAASAKYDPIYENRLNGTMTAEQQEVWLSWETPIKYADYEEKYASQKAEIDADTKAYNDAIKAGGVKHPSGVVTLNGVDYEPPEALPEKLTYDQFLNQARLELAEQQNWARERANADGRVIGRVEDVLSKLPPEEQSKLTTMSVPELIAMSGVIGSDINQINEFINVAKRKLGEKGFSDWVDKLRFGHVRHEAEYRGEQTDAENMTLFEYSQLADDADANHMLLGEYLSQVKKVPITTAFKIDGMLYDKLNDPRNKGAPEAQLNIVNNLQNYYKQIFAKKAGIRNPTEAEAFGKINQEKVRALSVQALDDYLNTTTNATIRALMKEGREKDAVDYLAMNKDCLTELHEIFEDLVDPLFD